MKKDRLRKGFSTGTALTAGILAGLRFLLGGEKRSQLALWIPAGFYITVPVEIKGYSNHMVDVEVIKDGGDDPDVTHGMPINVSVGIVEKQDKEKSRIWIDACEGVGTVTKPGLPVAVGEPAINPAPRSMIVKNVDFLFSVALIGKATKAIFFSQNPTLKIANFSSSSAKTISLELSSKIDFDIYVRVSIPGGERIAEKTLNPRLGVVGGLSILGTTGLVKPFSNESYRETIDYALRFAKANGSFSVVLTTGGKSEGYARAVLKGMPSFSFVQIADFFEFSLKRAEHYGFSSVILATFLGKAIKMALGYGYTHAHKARLDMKRLSEILNVSPEVSKLIASSNTAMEMVDILKREGLLPLIERIALLALSNSAKLAPLVREQRIIIFDYNGEVLSDLFNPSSF